MIRQILKGLSRMQTWQYLGKPQNDLSRHLILMRTHLTQIECAEKPHDGLEYVLQFLIGAFQAWRVLTAVSSENPAAPGSKQQRRSFVVR